MPSVTCFNFRFTPTWGMILLTALCFTLLLRLGFWQLQRADEKQHMLVAEHMRSKQRPTWCCSTNKPPQQYQPVSAEGRYLSDTFLLDNQHRQHQFGYDVLSPLVLKDGSVVFVDRGWVSSDNTRRTMPTITTPSDLTKLQGSVYYPSSKQWLLGENLEKKGDNISILEVFDPNLLSQVLQKRVYPYIIRLNKENADGFVKEWAIVSMPPQKHFGYAVQWFAMAFVVLILFIALNLKKLK